MPWALPQGAEGEEEAAVKAVGAEVEVVAEVDYDACPGDTHTHGAESSGSKST